MNIKLHKHNCKCIYCEVADKIWRKTKSKPQLGEGDNTDTGDNCINSIEVENERKS